MTRFVLVPGACHGGWWFEPLAAELRTAGHEADAVTLSGLDPDAAEAPLGSCWSMNNDEQREWYVSGSSRTGLAVDPLPFFDGRARPHPLATLIQASTLTGNQHRVARRTFALANHSDWVPHSPFVRIAEALRSDPDWTVIDLDATHNMLANGTDQLRELLLSHA